MMNKCLEENLEILKESSLQAYNRVMAYEDDEDGIRLKVAQQESEWICGETKGVIRHGFSDGFSDLDPEMKLVVLYGVGDGEYLSRVKNLPEVKEILVFEPSIGFFKSLLEQILL